MPTLCPKSAHKLHAPLLLSISLDCSAESPAVPGFAVLEVLVGVDCLNCDGCLCLSR